MSKKPPAGKAAATAARPGKPPPAQKKATPAQSKSAEGKSAPGSTSAPVKVELTDIEKKRKLGHQFAYCIQHIAKMNVEMQKVILTRVLMDKADGNISGDVILANGPDAKEVGVNLDAAAATSPELVEQIYNIIQSRMKTLETPVAVEADPGDVGNVAAAPNAHAATKGGKKTGRTGKAK